MFQRLKHLILSLVFLLAVSAGQWAEAVPCFGQKFIVRQPDGEQVTVVAWGDEFFFIQETVDGYTVTQDPLTGIYCYARLNVDGSALISTGIRIGTGEPNVPKHARISKEAQRAIQIAQRRAAGVRTNEAGWGHWASPAKAAPAPVAALSAAAPLPAPPLWPTSGTYQGLCILVDFEDEKAPAALPYTIFDAFLNGENYSDYGNRCSVYEFFRRASNGKCNYKQQIPGPGFYLQPAGYVPGYFRAKRPKSYYNDRFSWPGERSRELVLDALTELKNKNYDFTALTDVNQPNSVDAVSILYSGDSTPSTGLWHHSGDLAFPFAIGGGRTISKYLVTNIGHTTEAGAYVPEPTIGALCHESGHTLCGFPDVTDASVRTNGVGNWSLMAYGYTGTDLSGKQPVQLDGYMRYKAGWITATEVRPNQVVLDAAVMSGAYVPAAGQPAPGNCYIYRTGPLSPEYFLIENRNKSGEDISLPGSGLAIWHVNEGVLFNNNTSQSFYPELSLMQADGLNHLELTSRPNKGDPFDLFFSPGKTTFSDSTDPNAHWINPIPNGGPSFLQIYGISQAGTTMTFYMGPQSPPLIRTSPANKTVDKLATATFTVVSEGSPVQRYRWLRNNLDITGAPDSASYTTLPTTIDDNGSVYSCIVSNGVGSALSGNAILTVVLEPVVTVQPASVAAYYGETATFNVVATSLAPMAYSWQSKPPGGAWAGVTGGTGATTATYTTPALSNDALYDQAQYQCVITNRIGSTTSAPATVTIQHSGPVVITQPVSFIGQVGYRGQMNIVVRGSQPLSYQWQVSKNNGIWDNLTSSGAQTNICYTEIVTLADYNNSVNYQFRCEVSNSDPIEGFKQVTSDPITMTITNGPFFFVQPVSTSVVAGQPASFFSVVRPVQNTAPLRFTWQVKQPNGFYTDLLLIPGVTVTQVNDVIPGDVRCTLTIPAAAMAQVGDGAVLRCVAFDKNNQYSLSNNAILTVLGSPLIVTNPVSVNADPGWSVSFTTSALGAAALAYQWEARQADGSYAAITGATSTTYTTVADSLFDVAIRCRVTNAQGEATSTDATVARITPEDDDKKCGFGSGLTWMFVFLALGLRLVLRPRLR